MTPMNWSLQPQKWKNDLTSKSPGESYSLSGTRCWSFRPDDFMTSAAQYYFRNLYFSGIFLCFLHRYPIQCFQPIMRDESDSTFAEVLYSLSFCILHMVTEQLSPPDIYPPDTYLSDNYPPDIHPRCSNLLISLK